MNYKNAPPPERDLPVDLIKMPPHSVEAEQSVLGGLLLENSAWDRIADQMQRDLADLIRNELKDPRVGMATVN